MGLEVHNFSIKLNHWVYLGDLVSFTVDVIDFIYPVTTTGTYFIHDGTIVPTSFSAITDGYRASYSPDNLTNSGTIHISVHAQNDNNEIVEVDYEFLCGYRVEFEEAVNWGNKKDVFVHATAENESLCPNIEGMAFYFQTADLPGVNLGATIHTIRCKDLGASIYPQNTFFFYSRTYKVRIEGVKDFGGNELPVYEFEFTIEDPP